MAVKKIGRHAKRSAAAAKYKASNKREINRKRNLAKNHNLKAPLKVPRGTARAKRREAMQKELHIS